LKLESEWPSLEAKLEELYREYGKDGKAVLRAIWESNVKLKKRDNWFVIQTLAKRYGLERLV
jgi:hypothetical protein